MVLLTTLTDRKHSFDISQLKAIDPENYDSSTGSRRVVAYLYSCGSDELPAKAPFNYFYVAEDASGNKSLYQGRGKNPGLAKVSQFLIYPEDKTELWTKIGLNTAVHALGVKIKGFIEQIQSELDSSDGSYEWIHKVFIPNKYDNGTEVVNYYDRINFVEQLGELPLDASETIELAVMGHVRSNLKNGVVFDNDITGTKIGPVWNEHPEGIIVPVDGLPRSYPITESILNSIGLSYEFSAVMVKAGLYLQFLRDSAIASSIDSNQYGAGAVWEIRKPRQ